MIRWRFEGLPELREALRNLPAELTGEARHLITGAANTAAVRIRTGYGAHRRSGNLQDHVSVTDQTSSQFGVRVAVRSTARHAWLFELGTQARHTAIGANRGSMPAAHVFFPAYYQTRREMYDALKALLVRAGLRVSGEA